MCLAHIQRLQTALLTVHDTFLMPPSPPPTKKKRSHHTYNQSTSTFNSSQPLRSFIHTGNPHPLVTRDQSHDHWVLGQWKWGKYHRYMQRQSRQLQTISKTIHVFQ